MTNYHEEVTYHYYAHAKCLRVQQDCSSFFGGGVLITAQENDTFSVIKLSILASCIVRLPILLSVSKQVICVAPYTE